MSSSTTRDLLLLYDFIQNGDSELLRRYLSSHRVDINVVLPCKGVGLLHLAVGIEPEHASVECTEILLKHGADPNLCSEEGATPLHVAAVWGRLAALRLLVACGGEPARRDDDARTAYEYAAREQQWPVCDYLRRTFGDDAAATGPAEAAGDFDNSVCSYTLQLDRVLVSTGHVVAEYAPVSQELLQGVPQCRKSEMVREWCDKTTLVVNRLYPTILNQTYQIQDESVPWKPGDHTTDNCPDLTININTKKSEVKSPNETKGSFKSCFSKKLSPAELDVSGIQVLQETISEEDPNCNCVCHEAYTKPEICSRRVSVYENFSLPGSPANITHQNYKSKTSLRKNKSDNTTTNSSKIKSTKSNEMQIENASLMTSDHSNVLTLDATDGVTNESDGFYYVDYKSLNDALAIVQNETNEWLSQSNSSNESDEHLTTDVIELNDSDEHLAIDAIELNDSGAVAVMDGAKVDTDVKNDDSDTRRASQQSSGVHSNGSSSSIAIASVQEEYKYEDADEDVVLIEKRLIIPSVVLAVNEALADGGSPERSRHSMASSLPASIEYDTERLRAELRACGFHPGPITAATKRLYLRKLKLAVDEALADGGSPERSRHSMASSLPASIEYDTERLRAELRACGFHPGPITAATKRLYLRKLKLAVDEALADGGSPERSRHSMASSLPASIEYDTERLRAELRACGFHPGPITAATKRLYLRKLKSLKSGGGTSAAPAQGKTYSIELQKSLRNEKWFEDLSPYIALESAVREDFARPERARAWREGCAKTSFTYLLLDPRATDNLPVRAATQTRHAAWATFVNSIFYVGKGKRSRPYSHLYQALTLWKRDFRTSGDKKVQHILDIWGAQVGVVCLHVFQNVIPAEAYTHEAAMIDALGLASLRNLKAGNYYGVAESWPLRERRMLGLYLLYKSMLIFLSEGERQLRPGDID